MRHSGRTGILQVHHPRLLPLRSRSHTSLRHHKPRIVQQRIALAVGGQDKRQLGDVLRDRGQQVRHGKRVHLSPPSRKVTYEEGAKFAKDNNLIFLEVSAKTAYQVEDAFKKNAELLLEKIEKGTINMESEVSLPPTQPPGIKKGNLPDTKVKLDISSESAKPEKKKCC
jgi:GTPase SAR1 family protein